MDVPLELFLSDGDEIIGPPVLAKQVRGDDVHTFIGALGRQDRGDQKLERVAVVKGAMSIRVGFLQPPDYLGRAFLQVFDHSGIEAKKESPKMQTAARFDKIDFRTEQH